MLLSRWRAHIHRVPCVPQALLALADATDYTGWTKASGWCEGSKPVCAWHGVTCNTAGRVEGLSLKSNALSGSIP